MNARSVFLAVACRPAGPADADFAVQRPTAGRYKAVRARGSLLCLNFNRAWADGLNRRAGLGLTHWALQHDDITPEAGWADVAIDELDRTGADGICPVIPCKDARGLTSTAVRDPATDRVRRLTMREAHRLPPTFDAADCRAAGVAAGDADQLLVNTGLLVVRLDRPWVEDFPGFANGYDGVSRGPDGVWRAGCFSEDWTFSVWCAENGVRLLATTKVKAVHHGADGDYPNTGPWGTCGCDPGD